MLELIVSEEVSFGKRKRASGIGRSSVDIS